MKVSGRLGVVRLESGDTLFAFPKVSQGGSGTRPERAFKGRQAVLRQEGDLFRDYGTALRWGWAAAREVERLRLSVHGTGLDSVLVHRC